MSGVSRFLSKRDKNHKHHISPHLHVHHEKTESTSSSIAAVDGSAESTSTPGTIDFYGLFTTVKPSSVHEEPKVKSIRQRIVKTKGVLIKDDCILWGLRSRFAPGDADLIYDLIVAMIDAYEGILTPYNPDIRLRGANNRELVTCFLDSTLFAMFSRLDSFEAMLYNSFDDKPREKLAFLLRLWVNLLRSGKLITTDITEEIQKSLAECGWEEAREIQQQDASEAFAFITEKLNLPLLTLKMDIYHTGRQDNDDHKFIKERLLEVGIPRLSDGTVPAAVKLEDCLEEFFNNKIEVKRFLERRNTTTSMRSMESKSKAVHVETVELDSDMPSPLTPLSSIPSHSASERPQPRHRAPSIIQERFIPDKDDAPPYAIDDSRGPVGRVRGGSVRKEVLMPAWQFFSLIPWYTDKAPANDAQVADHFSTKRPVLGLCLKRYDYTNTGQAIRLDTDIDIPIDIALPHFIQDDHTDEGGPAFGNFKLSLQSAVCHRGNSVHSGHYVALVRSTTEKVKGGEEEMSHWLRFDDLASPKISLIDIRKALREEKPYLLFYQILPIDGDPGNVTSGEAPPSYPTTPIAETHSDLLRPFSQSPPTQPQMEPLIAVQSIDSSTLYIPKVTSDRNSLETMSSSDDGRSKSAQHMRRPSAISFTEQIPPSRKSLENYREQTLNLADHRKSGSFTNNTGSGSLGRTLSKFAALGRNSGSKEALPLKPEDGISPGTVDDSHGKPTPVGGLVVDTARSKSDAAAPSTGLGRSHSKREKSRSRLMKAASKARGQDDERECVVM